MHVLCYLRYDNNDSLFVLKKNSREKHFSQPVRLFNEYLRYILPIALPRHAFVEDSIVL